MDQLQFLGVQYVLTPTVTRRDMTECCNRTLNSRDWSNRGPARAYLILWVHLSKYGIPACRP